MIFKYKESKLSYSVAGAPDGFPVFLNYGLIGSAESPKSYRSLLLRENIKLIILERPGYGSSDYINMESYTDWNSIVEDFLAELEIKDFAVIGISAGAPYAYAMAHHFSEQLTGGVYILSGLPYLPDGDVIAQYTGQNKLFYEKIWNYSQNELQDEMFALLKKYDNFFFNLIMPKSFRNGLKAGFAQHCAGVGQSIRLQMQDWGFDPYALESKINLWHSAKDKEVPLEAVKVMTAKMKSMELHIKGKGHMPGNEIFMDVLKSIKSVCKVRNV